MQLKPGLHRTSPLDVELTWKEAVQEGFTTFVLPATGIVDRASFFDAVRATFPLDPPLVGSHSWDALSDSLFEGLHAHPDRRIAILWPGAHAMTISSRSEFDIAVEVLSDVAALLASPKATVGQPKEVVVLVE